MSTTTSGSVLFSPPHGSSRSRAGLFTDRSGETAGVHEPVSWSPTQAGTPNREAEVRRIGAGRKNHRTWVLRQVTLQTKRENKAIGLDIFAISSSLLKKLPLIRARYAQGRLVKAHKPSCLGDCSYPLPECKPLGGDVALHLAEFLLKSCQTGLNRVLLEHRRKEKPYCFVELRIRLIPEVVHKLMDGKDGHCSHLSPARFQADAEIAFEFPFLRQSLQ